MSYKRHYKSWQKRYHNYRQEARERSDEYDYTHSPNPRRFYRSNDNRILAGVCGGIGEYFGWDPILVRIIAGLSFITGVFSGVVFFGYLIAWFIAPRRPHSQSFKEALKPEEEAFWKGVSDRPKETFSNIRYKFKDLDQRLQGLERVMTSEEWQLRKQFRELEKN